MTADSGPLRPELKQLRANVEDVIRELGVSAEWADDLPTRVRNIITSLQADIAHCQNFVGEHMRKRSEAEGRMRQLLAEMDAQVGAEHRTAHAVELVKGGIATPSEVQRWDDIGGPDAEPSSA